MIDLVDLLLHELGMDENCIFERSNLDFGHVLELVQHFQLGVGR